MTLENGTICDVQYGAFRISDEWSDYKLSTLGTFESDADCTDVYNAGNTQDGVYYIRPAGWNDPPFKVFCNMSIDGGKWTVFQRRVNGSTNFYRNWTEYRNGFGDIKHEFWLGNEKLHFLTKQATYEYRVDFVTASLTSYHNKYNNFYVDNEDNKYRLADVGTRTGTAGYSLHGIQNTPFSTYDEDNDGRTYNCAEEHRSCWWHGADFIYVIFPFSNCRYFPSGNTTDLCSYSNLNGDYNGGNGENIYDLTSYYYCNQKYTEMKIRRIS
ncbi:Microfibril-associated glycoprotein 4 [Holothuria leucospilota]|uniref:Microfibril-associated glycoprotein 4 n=1 Tax=Holothuria leucospilota TaxID=206669 RepID=A0A9Q1H5X0_HOLLE|nr:Microfibril-associated glycoprotein 4 [Holothuria leucospilota]